MDILKAWSKLISTSENINASNNAVKTLDTVHERTHAGKVFHHTQVNTLAAGAEATMLFYVDSSSEIHLTEIEYNADVGVCEGYLYENPYIDVNSLGIGVAPKNTNRESSYNAVGSFYIGAYLDVNSLGEQIDADAMVQSTGGSIKSVEGSIGSAVTEWILKRGNNYAYRFINKSGSTAFYDSHMSFYEPFD